MALQNSTSKTPGKDKIPLRILQKLSQTGKKCLLQIFNRIWQDADIPHQWLESIIVPILKPGKDPRDLTSYRPISLTSTTAKVFERILMFRMTKWILAKDIFHKNHFGFLPFRDCASALMKIYNDLINARRQKFHVILVTLDITGAYDSVCHDSLAIKLLTAGLDGHLAKWIFNFTTLRTFQVRWKGCLSDPKVLEVGVPQGCVLSPYLFSFYMRDFFETLEPGVEGVIYADDTFIYAAGPSYVTVKSKIQKTLQNVVTWGKYWNLSFSPSKSKILNMSNKRSKSDDPVYLEGTPIPWAKSVKILGLWFTSNLTWNTHIAELRKKTFRKLNAFKSIASIYRGITTKDLLNIGRMGVISHLHYGSPIHYFASKTTREKLEPLLNSVLRIATGLPKWTPIPILRRITKTPGINDSHFLQRQIFIIRHISLGEFSPIADLVSENGKNSILSSQVTETLHRQLVSAKNLIKLSLVKHDPKELRISFQTKEYKFQDKSLHPEYIKRCFQECMENWKDWHIIATDASKDSTSTKIGVWDITRKFGHSHKVDSLNSVFSAEALGLWAALKDAPCSGKLILLSDSLSVITALSSIHQKSHKVILFLYKALALTSLQLEAIRVIWVPGHSGIQCNEIADQIARNYLYPDYDIPEIAPEDVIHGLRDIQREENCLAWLGGKYVNDFPHLTKSSWNHRKLQLPRKGEVLLARLQTRTLPTYALLYRFGMCSSPLCPACQVPETSDHYLLECRKFKADRDILFKRLGISSLSATFSNICDLAVSGRSTSRFLVSFLLGSARF